MRRTLFGLYLLIQVTLPLPLTLTLTLPLPLTLALTLALTLRIQLGLPARMPLVSGFEFPRNALGYRFSWTMMLHATTHFIELKVPRGSLVPRAPVAWESHVAPTLGTLPSDLTVGPSKP